MLKLTLFLGLLISAIALDELDGSVRIPSNYSKFHVPVVDRSKPLKVTVAIIIIQILHIDFEKSALAFDVEFILTWQDELISITEGLDEEVIVGDSSILWLPDLYVFRLKHFSVKKTNRLSSSLTLRNNGSVVDVEYLLEAKVETMCDAQFADFPFNKHECFLQIGSFSKNASKIIFTPDYQYDLSTLVELKSFDYDITASYLTGPDTVVKGVKDPQNVYSVVGIKLDLYNKWTKYITLYYVPTGLIVITSWIFFLLPSTSYPARTALLVTVFLLLISIFSSVVNETPNTSDGGWLFISLF